MTFSSFLSETFAFTRNTLIGKWSRWLIFLLLSLPALALSLIVTSKTVVDGTVIHWDAIPWPEVIPLAGAAVVCSFFVSGYTVRLLRGGGEPAEFDRWAALALDGIRLDIVVLIWALPFVAFELLQLFTFSTRLTSLSLSSLLSMVIVLPVILIGDLVILALLVFFGIVGITRFARTGLIREAFAIRAIESDIDRMGFGGYLFALVILLVIQLVFGIVVDLLSLVPEAGFLFPFVLGPWLTVFQFRYISGLYDAGETEARKPAAVPGTGPEGTHPTGKQFLMYGGALLIILAACLVPAYALMQAMQFPSVGGLPPMTVNELNQSKQDDISIYSSTGSFSSPQFTRDSHILYSAEDCSAVTPVAGVTQASSCAHDLWIMDRSGGSRTQLTHDAGVQQFSADPSSGRIAFDRHVNGQNVISVIPAPGSEPAVLPGPLPYMFFSSWSPDGSRIAATGFNLSDYNGYSYSGSPDDKSPATGTTWSRLFVMNPDGSNPQEFARVGTKAFSLRTESSWSPDGTELAVPLAMPGQNGIGVITVATGSVRAVTQDENPSDNIIDRKVDDYPRWSPKGDLIAFIRDGDVWTVRPDGSGLQKITTDGTVDTLAWNPDGTRLAFSAESYLGIVDPDGSNRNRISNIQPGPLSWSPDGKTITYAPGLAVRIRITTLTPGVLKMGDFMSNQMDQMMPTKTTTTWGVPAYTP